MTRLTDEQRYAEYCAMAARQGRAPMDYDDWLIWRDTFTFAGAELHYALQHMRAVVWAELRAPFDRLLCRVLGHDWRWRWDGGKYEHHYCARCGKRLDIRGER